MNRNQRAEVAKETLEIIERGCYVNGSSKTVDISDLVKSSIKLSKHYAESDLVLAMSKIRARISQPLEKQKCNYTVENCTTFAGVKKLLNNSDAVVCLNFASAKNPGGGFLGGSQAQEETLARASAIYPCLTND